ncbi:MULTISPECIES: AAA family ATPase [Clostridia]|uniref:AAA family ATPase n=1 Tax=Clostridia TaxID=186801 RepID=UPI0015FB240D|nr:MULTISPECIES: AAA family ATPase [Clostridia]
MNQLNEFIIYGLWGEKNYKLNFNNNRLIIVGENGSGKTTILRILYYCLSSNWSELNKEDFQQIKITFGKESRKFDKEQLNEIREYALASDNEIFQHMPSSMKDEIFEYKKMFYPSELIEILNNCSFPKRFLEEILSILEELSKKMPEDMKEITEWISNNLKCKIIYMPTYRRTEHVMSKRGEYFGRINRHRNIRRRTQNKFMEISNMGMQDVADAINKNIVSIKDAYNITASRLNLNCFRGILIQDYQNHLELTEESTEPEYIEMVFNGMNYIDMPESELMQVKDTLLEVLEKKDDYQEYDKIVIYFYNMLVERYEQLKDKENKLEHFFHSCNLYLSNKNFIYKPNEFKYAIEVDSNKPERKEIGLEQLSSGEKQIVALFSYLFLSDDDSIMILIDEPELSLSVMWQERILEDITEGENCVALVATTQSPFVYDNSLRTDAHALEEFLILE